MGLAWLLPVAGLCACARDAQRASKDGGASPASNDAQADGSVRRAAGDGGALARRDAGQDPEPVPDAIAPLEPEEKLDGGVSDASVVGPRETSDAEVPPAISCAAVATQLTDDEADKSSLDVALLHGELALAWIADDSVVLTQFAEPGVPTPRVVEALELAGAFDPHVLLAGSETAGMLFVSDATRLRGVALGPSLSSANELSLDTALPLVDAHAVWLGDRAAVFGLDVFQGCGLFLRAAVLADDGEPSLSMSDCLVNFSGALSDLVLVGGQVRLLVGERLMSFEPTTSAYTETPLQESSHRWQQQAVLSWGEESGVLITADPEGATSIERIDESARVQDSVQLPGRSVIPQAIEAGPQAGRYRWVGLRGEEPEQTLVLSVVSESLEVLTPLVPIAAVSEPEDVKLVRSDEVTRVLWLDTVDGVRQVFAADVECRED